ncbi:tyrosine-type recombinase/integrase [Blastomonas fulva]|jgi:integrase|uniref:tyrosine-type recombinase/integrase n=1 Tax=Blastomonas fulva TaxID=1550728 RepID=UPI003D283423
MPIVKLNATTVLTAVCPPGKAKIDLFDEDIPGFLLEVRPTGNNTFGLRYRDDHNRQRQIKIGNAADISPSEARKIAQRLKAQAITGRNPAQERKDKRNIPTVAELSVRYLEYAKTYKRSYDIDDRYLRLHLLPRFGRLHLDQLDQTQIMDWLASKVADGYAQATVNRWQVILSHMMRMAKKWGLPGSERNPLEGVKQKECNNQIERYLTPAETARLKVAVDSSPNTQLKYIVALLLLTGCRKRELLDARWEHFDLERKAWRIPMSKTGKARHVPLSDQALAVLEQVPRFKGCDWLLPNPATLKPFTAVYNAWDTARRAAGLPDFRMHDCRHTHASQLCNSGQSLYVIGKVLGHAQAKTTERYAHLSQETLLNAVNLAAEASGTDWAEGV